MEKPEGTKSVRLLGILIDTMKITLFYILIDIVLAIVLLIINRLLGSLLYQHGKGLLEYNIFPATEMKAGFSGNFFLKIVVPTIFASVCAGILQRSTWSEATVQSCLIVPLYWIFRWGYIRIIDKVDAVNRKYERASFAFSLILCALVYILIISPLYKSENSILISAEELRDALWFAIISCVALSFWKLAKSFLSFDNLYPDSALTRVYSQRFYRIKNKYGELIEKEIKRHFPQDNCFNFKCLVYSIIIQEDYERPRIHRIFENLIFRFRLKRKMTLGIMQVSTDRLISDEESIKKGIEKLANSYGPEKDLQKAIHEYNNSGEYEKKINMIYFIVHGIERQRCL